MAARRAVLDTAELLETILLGLDTKTPLLSRRVCKDWQEAIQSSIKVQQALFFLPIAVKDLRYHGHSISLESFQPGPWVHGATGLEVQAIYGNPLSKNYINFKRQDQLQKYKAFHQWYTIRDRPEASCHRMLLCQPALKSIRYNCTDTNSGRINISHGSVIVDNSNGVTAGDVYDRLKEVWQKHDRKVRFEAWAEGQGYGSKRAANWVWLQDNAQLCNLDIS